MKKTPCAYLFCAVALFGLPLVSVSAPAAVDEEISPAVLKKYDVNQDGSLDESEKAAWRADKEKSPATRAAARHAADLARYDVNQDGKLNPEERAAKKAEAEKTRAEKKAARDAKKAERAAAAEAKKLTRYDRNQDGKLDEAELAVAKADDATRRAAAEKRKAARAASKPDPDAEKPVPEPADDPPTSGHE